MTNKNEGGNLIPTTETEPKQPAQEHAPKPTGSELVRNENSALETEILNNEAMSNSLEQSLNLDEVSDRESGESKIDPKITDYFRNTLGADETLRRLQQMGESGIQRIVKEIQAGNFRLVTHLMELNNPNSQWDTQAALDSVSDDPAARDRGFAAMSEHFANYMGIVKGIEERHNPEDSARWAELYNLLGISKSKEFTETPTVQTLEKKIDGNFEKQVQLDEDSKHT